MIYNIITLLFHVQSDGNILSRVRVTIDGFFN
jgi:hypothetical protein